MMKTFSSAPCLVALALAMIVCSAVLANAREMEDESEFNYVVGGSKGPGRWGYLNTTWAACTFGTAQSPIDLPSISPHQPVSDSDRVDFFYNPGGATVKNKGHDIEVKWRDGVSKIRTDSVEYILKQAHWHTPSEHTIYGTRFAMELHLVHQNPNITPGVAVVAFLYKLGPPDPFLALFMDEISTISDTSKEVDAGVVNPTQAIRGGRQDYYRYTGSLTTPPCTEGVVWTVETQIRTVSQEQINLLRKAVNHDSMENARPLQERNGRWVSFYKSNQH